ncbi:MAG: ABC transporter ATP-binding protein [Phycisphaerales bacterium]
MIEVHQLTKWYGPVLALDHINLHVPAGRIVGFLGPNGAGKTTTLRILTAFMPASDGSAKLNGHDVFTHSALVRDSIGYLPESNPLYSEMRVEEHLHHFGKLHHMPRNLRRKRIDELADRCGLSHIRRRLVGQLSKGNRQRVGIAQALLHNPPILILDEPTAGLDPTQITEIRKLIASLAGQKTVLLSTHILPEAEKTCEQLVIIAAGKIVAQGTPDDLKAQVRQSARIIIELKADPIAVRDTLTQLPGVADVQEVDSRDGWCAARVTPNDPHSDIRELLGQTAQNHHWLIREMRHERASLEEFFVQITAPQSSLTAA